MEYVIGFLIILGLIVFFLPVSLDTKKRRLEYWLPYLPPKRRPIIVEIKHRGLFGMEATIFDSNKHKYFMVSGYICFGYTDIKYNHD